MFCFGFRPVVKAMIGPRYCMCFIIIDLQQYIILYIIIIYIYDYIKRMYDYIKRMYDIHVIVRRRSQLIASKLHCISN